MTISGGDVSVDRHAPVVIGPPLRGDRFIAADSCCDATRHTRAALPVDGRVRIAQRYAVDWEQMDDANRIYVGPRAEPKSYTIYGHEALAVANARIASVVDGNPSRRRARFRRRSRSPRPTAIRWCSIWVAAGSPSMRIFNRAVSASGPASV
jgi:hypothetical protein